MNGGFANSIVNLSDPTGATPADPTIRPAGDPEFTYSCDCGWIDWKHANPAMTAIKVLHYVRRALDYFKNNPGTRFVVIRGEDVQHAINVPLLGPHTTFGPYVLIDSRLSEDNWVQVAMALFRNVESAHENNPWSWLTGLSPLWTHYAEEDLTSDLIAFYRALDVENWDFPNAFQVLSQVCRFPSNMEQSRQWSKQVYDEYGGYEQIREWESPRLHSTPAIMQYCGDAPRQWPSELSTIQPNYDVWKEIEPYALPYYMFYHYPELRGMSVVSFVRRQTFSDTRGA